MCRQIVAGLVALAACGKSDEKTRLFAEKEIAAYVAATNLQLEANGKRTCSTKEIVALVEETPCPAELAAAVKHPQTLEERIAAKDPEALKLVANCGTQIAGRIHDVAAADACSPYQVGLRPMPKLDVIQAIKVADYWSRIGVETGGDPAVALDQLVDTLEAAQDLWRGRVAMIYPMVAVALTEITSKHIEAVLDQAGAKLTPPQLDGLAKRLDDLIAHIPDWVAVWEGEYDYGRAVYGVGALDAKYELPGGWGTDRPVGSGATGEHWGDPRDEAAIMFEVFEKQRDGLVNACPAKATIRACFDGVEKAANERQASTANIASVIGAGGDVKSIRQQIVAILMSIATPMYGDYVRKHGKSAVRLAWLRGRIEVLRTKKCVEPISPAILGEKLPFVVTDDKVTLTLPKWLLGRTNDISTYEMTCGAKEKVPVQ